MQPVISRSYTLPCVLEVEESRIYGIDALVEETGLESRRVAELFVQLAGVEHAAATELSRVGLDASEANPAAVRGSQVYTGDWVGVAVLRVDGVVCTLALRPKIKRFNMLVSKALETLHLMGLLGLYARLLSALSSAGALRIPGAVLAAEYISEWARSRPPTPTNMATTAYMVYAALSAASERIRELHVPRIVALHALQPLIALASEPIIAHALLRVDDAEPDVDRVLEAALLAKASLLYTQGTTIGPVLLLPSPKLFEFAVLAETIKLLRAFGRYENPRWDQETNTVRCGTATTVYYNASPASRLVEKLAGTHLHPDIVVQHEGRLVVIEAKYRRRGSRLTLGDAARIAAYLYDIQPDYLIIVYPEHPEKPRTVAENVVETSIYTLPTLLQTILSSEDLDPLMPL